MGRQDLNAPCNGYDHAPLIEYRNGRDAGFEPTTTTPPVWCATRLRYVPKRSDILLKCRGNSIGIHAPKPRLERHQTVIHGERRFYTNAMKIARRSL